VLLKGEGEGEDVAILRNFGARTTPQILELWDQEYHTGCLKVKVKAKTSQFFGTSGLERHGVISQKNGIFSSAVVRN
jgi:hypothetical protein